MKGFDFYRIVKAAGFLLQKPLQTQRSIRYTRWSRDLL